MNTQNIPTQNVSKNVELSGAANKDEAKKLLKMLYIEIKKVIAEENSIAFKATETLTTAEFNCGGKKISFTLSED